MSLHYPSDDSQMSFSDNEEVINPEDLDLDGTESQIDSREDVPANDEAAETEESQSYASEEDSDEDGDIDPEFREILEEIGEIHEYAEEDRGMMSSW